MRRLTREPKSPSLLIVLRFWRGLRHRRSGLGCIMLELRIRRGGALPEKAPERSFQRGKNPSPIDVRCKAQLG
jgi:hypothetical protein